MLSKFLSMLTFFAVLAGFAPAFAENTSYETAVDALKKLKTLEASASSVHQRKVLNEAMKQIESLLPTLSESTFLGASQTDPRGTSDEQAMVQAYNRAWSTCITSGRTCYPAAQTVAGSCSGTAVHSNTHFDYTSYECYVRGIRPTLKKM